MASIYNHLYSCFRFNGVILCLQSMFLILTVILSIIVQYKVNSQPGSVISLSSTQQFEQRPLYTEKEQREDESPHDYQHYSSRNDLV